MTVSDNVEVHIQGLAHGGAGIGTVTGGATADRIGKKAFVHFSIPGEEIEARVLTEEKKFLSAEIVTIKKASPDRICPPCPYFRDCGGCDLQHISLSAQRAAKRDMIESTFRVHKLKLQSSVQLLGENLPGYAYRRRIQVHISMDGELGFFRSGTGDVVDIEACALADARLNTGLTLLRTVLPQIHSFVAGAALELHNESVCLALDLREGTRLTQDAQGFLSVLETGFSRIDIRQDSKIVQSTVSSESSNQKNPPLAHFSQVNQSGNEFLVQTVLNLVPEGSVTEFYAGAGNFSLPLAAQGRSVKAVEVDKRLVAFGEQEAQRLGLAQKVHFSCASAEAYVKQHKLAGAILLDPPRSGAKAVVSEISPERTARVVYVSCNLPTLCRDLIILQDKSYRLEETYFVDMFPQTHFVETISMLSLA